MDNNKSKPVRIMLDLCATIIHHGHIRLINRAKSHFKNSETEIVIGLASDIEIEKHKGYVPELNFSERKEILEALKNVNEIVSTPFHITEAILKEHQIDYLIHGSDNQNEVENLIVFSKTKDISSSELRERSLRSIVHKRTSNKIMFTPGPSNMSYLNMLDLRSVFGRGDDEYTNIENQVLENILKLTGQEQILRFQGGGTTAIDIATSNFTFGKILIIDAGYYSRRLELIINKKLDTLPNTSVKVINYQDIEKELAIKDSYDWVATAYAETADAFLCDIKLLRTLADLKNAKLFLDATASINLEQNHQLADVCTFSSCKGLGGLTGAGFIAYKNSAYDENIPKKNPFSLDLATHMNKLYTGPYHAICSLFTISKNFNAITENVEKSKDIFLKKNSNRVIRPLEQQPKISTLIKAKEIIPIKNAVLYQPRTLIDGTAVICHLGDMFTLENQIGEIYDILNIK